MMGWPLLFLSNFVLVFLLGIQSRNVVAANYVAATATSIGISVCNFTFAHAAATGSFDVFLPCALGGATGICASIWFYQRFMTRKKENG